MAINNDTIQPTPITAAPEAPTGSHTREQFVPLAFQFMAWQSTLRNGANALAENVYQNAQKTHAFAQHAHGSAEAAEQSKNAAAHSAQLAATAPTVSGTSSSNITIGTGSINLVTQTGRAFMPGQYVAVARTASPATHRMLGAVSSYDAASGQLQVEVNHASGSGAHTGWSISVATPPAPATMPVHRITASAVALPGLHYSLAAAGITLHMPAAPAAGDCIAFTNATTQAVFINWSGKTVKGIAPQPQAMRLPLMGHAAVVFDGQTWLPMPGVQA